MKRILLLAASAVLATAGALAAAGPASADSGDVTCPNGFLGVLIVPHDLTVPPDGSCGLTQGSTIGHDVTVDQGGAFFIGGTAIGHDLTANGAKLIELGDVNNGSTDTTIGGNVTINGTIGTLPFGQFICQTRIVGNLSITGTQTTSSGWDIGAPEPANCGRNTLHSNFADTIGGDATFSNNASSLDIGFNTPAFNGGTGPGFGHDLTLNGNTNTTLDRNNIVHNCTQSNNHPFAGTGNTAGSSVDACNSSNP